MAAPGDSGASLLRQPPRPAHFIRTAPDCIKCDRLSRPIFETGGIGADVFRFDSVSDSLRTAFDVISDFTRAHGDRIDLRTIDANAKLAGNQAFSYLGASAFTGAAGQLTLQNQHLRGDVNGDRIADFDIHLVGVQSLLISEIWL